MAAPGRIPDSDPLLKHGSLRGLPWGRSHPLASPNSIQFEGRFGRMFGDLPAADISFEVLDKLAAAMTLTSDSPQSQPDPNENPHIGAGYTYLGQFITHDLSFDPSSVRQQEADPTETVDFRTPRLDLDSLYGQGPDDQPFMYSADQRTFLLGEPLTGNPRDRHACDLPRNRPGRGERARAVIGDPRNDENVIVCQLHAAMLRFHNLLAARHKHADFEVIQQWVRWHYQWIVVHDYLPRVIGEDLCDSILPARGGPRLKFFDWRRQPYMPVEFSAAAFRFGHAMIRPNYRLNSRVNLELKDLFLFGRFPQKWAIDWSLFFDFGRTPKTGPKRLQPSYRIQTSLVHPLAHLKDLVGADLPSLAQRDLWRGQDLGLPSGQDVARFMGEEPLPDEEIRIGPSQSRRKNPSIVEIDPEFKGRAPLWVYILAEAEHRSAKDHRALSHLGPVGGRIVGEVIVGLLLADSQSFLNARPAFLPLDAFSSKGRFGMAELLKTIATAA